MGSFSASNFQKKQFYIKGTYWIKLVFATGTAQILVQAFGFISGIAIIRYLPTEEYALYTLANTMLGAVSILSDSGVSNGVMAEGGKVWNSREQLGAVIVTGMGLRKKLTIISLIVMVPIMGYLFWQHGASWWMSLLIIAAFIPALYASLSDSLLEIAPKLHQQILPLQKNQVEVSILRLILTFCCIFIFPFAYIVILASGLPRIYGNFKLKKITNDTADLLQISDTRSEREILKQVKRTMPMCMYAVVSGQIGIWIISFFGKTSSIAEIGALSRLSVLFTLFSTIIGTILLPRFAKIPHEKKKLLRFFLFTLGITSIFCFFIIASTILFSNQVLWILGKNYSKLSYELILNIAISCIGLLATICSNLILSRGWIIKPYIPIVANIICLIGGLFIFNLHTLVGVLYYNILGVFVHFSIVLLFALISIYNKNYV